jgi:chromosome partitioning protein
MGKIIAILNQKGGVGKTTITSNLGVSLRNKGYKTLLVDADPQGSLRDWNEQNNGELISVIALDRETIYKDLNSFKEQFDYIIIDGAPQISALAGAAIKAADIVLIPVTPSPYDVWACSDLVELVKTRQEITDFKLKAFFVISRARKNTTLTQDVNDALAGYELPILKNKTMHREIYAKTASDGQTVFADNSAIDAQHEINAIINEIINC